MLTSHCYTKLYLPVLTLLDLGHFYVDLYFLLRSWPLCGLWNFRYKYRITWNIFIVTMFNMILSSIVRLLPVLLFPGLCCCYSDRLFSFGHDSHVVSNNFQLNYWVTGNIRIIININISVSSNAGLPGEFCVLSEGFWCRFRSPFLLRSLFDL